MFNNEETDIEQNKDNLIQQILNNSSAIKSIKLYSSSEFNFSISENKLLKQALFYKLFYKSPLQFAKLFYEFEEKKSLKEVEIANILDKEGGGRKTMKSWLSGFEMLGCIERTKPPGNHTVRPRYTYSLKYEIYSQITEKLPYAYCCLALNNKLSSKNFYGNEDGISLDHVYEYIDEIDEKLSYIRVDNENDHFRTTRIIHTLLDNGATVHQAFSILDEISKKMAHITPHFIGLPCIIGKEYIIHEILKALENKEMYQILYSYKFEDIIGQYNIKYTTNVVELFKKKIKEMSWDSRLSDSEVYSEVFDEIYDVKYQELMNKKLIISQVNEFIKNHSDDYIEINNTKYIELIKEIALSMLINIGYLSSPSNPIGSLKNILMSKKEDHMVKKIRSNKFYNDFYKNVLIPISRIIEQTSKNKEIRETDGKKLNIYLQKFISFYKKTC